MLLNFFEFREHIHCKQRHKHKHSARLNNASENCILKFELLNYRLMPFGSLSTSGAAAGHQKMQVICSTLQKSTWPFQKCLLRAETTEPTLETNYWETNVKQLPSSTA